MSPIEALDPKVRECIRKCGLSELSPAQEKAIPLILKGSNIVLIAPTGTGKIESAMFRSSMRSSRCRPAAGSKQSTLLRSLNWDILARMQWWCAELGLTVGVRHGDTPMNKRRKQPLSPPDLLITTPETVQAIFMGKCLRKHLSSVKFVIIDEIHELAGSKRGAQIAVALEWIHVYAGDFQRIGLSATVGNPDDIGKFLCGTRPFSIVQVPVAKQLEIAVRHIRDNFEH